MLMFLGSAVGWTFSSVDNAGKDEEKEKAIREVAVGFQNAIVEAKPRPTGQKCNCNAIFDGLIKRHVEQHKSEH